MSNFQNVPKAKLCHCVTEFTDGLVRLALPTCLYCCGKGLQDGARKKTIRRNQTRLIPTVEDFNAFTGAHCKIKYASLSIDWQCPACRRTSYELLRWTMLYPNKPSRKMGWAMGLHEHHDHRCDQYLYSSKPFPLGFRERFPRTIICEQCNSADATAKRKLKLPKDFSFSPTEISLFVTAVPHGWHLLDYDIAAQIYARFTSEVPATAHFFWRPAEN